MELKDYFEGVKGKGVLATADGEGKVNMAVYAKPHFVEDGNIAFIMADRLTHHNLQSNDSATYLFLEEGKGYKGKRLYLTKTGEEQDSVLLYTLRNRKYASDKEDDKPRFLVFFNINKVLPLIGAGEA